MNSENTQLFPSLHYERYLDWWTGPNMQGYFGNKNADLKTPYAWEMIQKSLIGTIQQSSQFATFLTVISWIYFTEWEHKSYALLTHEIASNCCFEQHHIR